MSSPRTAVPQHNQLAQLRSNDTDRVWKEVKYYEAKTQYSMEGLYVDFRETFDGWTKERFQKVDPAALRALKWTLRHGGVYTGNIRKRTAGALADLAQLPCVEGGMWPRPPYWDREEFMKMRFHPESEVYAHQTTLKQQFLQLQAQHSQMMQAQQPAQQPAQGPLQAAPSQPLQGTGISQYQAPQTQQQPGHPLQRPVYQQQPNSGAAQPPPYSRQPPQMYNNPKKRKASQAMDPSPQQIQQRSAMSSSAQQPTIRQGSGQGSVQGNRYEDYVFEESDSNGDLHDDDDDESDDY